MSTYPNSILVKANVTNEVDDVDQNDHNILKGEIIALQTYVGTSPQGSRNDLTTRLTYMINGSGVVNNSTGFHTDTTPCRLHYRTDSETLYIRRADNTNWQSIGGSFSNIIYSWRGVESGAIQNTFGFGFSNGLAGGTSGDHFYMIRQGNSVGSYVPFLNNIPFIKISGIATLDCYVKTKSNALQDYAVRFNAGALNKTYTVTAAQTTGTLIKLSLDVSSLNNGTYYNMQVDLSETAVTGNTYSMHLLTVVAS